MRVVLLSFAFIVLAACASTPAVEKQGARSSREYVPLAVGNTWVYAVTPSPPDKPTDEVKILDKDQKGFFVDSKGGTLAPRTDGIFDGKRFLLQDPIVEGHEWMAAPEPTVVEKYVIKATGVSLSVPAGNFSDCVDVESKLEVRNPQNGQPGVLTVTWTYAPGVGLVRLVQSFKPGELPEQVVARMELVSFDVKPTE